MEFSSRHINYLSRDYLDEETRRKPITPASQDVFIPDQSSLALMHLSGVSRFWESVNRDYGNIYQHRYRMEDVLIGCHGAGLPLIFLVYGSSSSPEIEIDMGTMEPLDGAPQKYGPETAIHFISKSLPGHYPGIQAYIKQSEGVVSIIEGIRAAKFFGLVTGTPAMKVTDEMNDPTQLDRLIRTMYSSDWGLLVIAHPLTYREMNSFSNSVLNEMRQITNAEQTKQTWAPMAKSYYEMLEQMMKEVERGKSTGLWATTIYYFSSEKWHFLKLGAAVRAYYGGEMSVLDPVRTLEIPDLHKVVPKFGQPVLQPDPGPGQFRYPFQYQTVLNSNRLSFFVHLPRLEIPGFSIKESCYFDVVSHQESETQLIELGDILHFGGPIGSKYKVNADSLQKHTLIVGVTGSGKTNTAFYLLEQMWDLGIPFLVLEPAKTEYRALLIHERIGSEIRIFTLGEEQVSPLRINPFEVEAGVSVATHIDLLKSVFNASFGLWNPLPQVLEQCIHAIYRDCGWDPSRNVNFRLESGTNGEEARSEEAYPTLTDLYEKIEEIVNALGYEERIQSNFKAALMTRINGLRIGSKGMMLDTNRSIPIAELLSKPTIIELEQIGDDDEKAFLMGLLMIKIYEHLRGHGSTEGTTLKHIMVIEEAHRLLSNVPPQLSQEQSNVRGRAVETFTNMLSEIRAYGEGFIVAEQIAVKLALDVIKNTNLKIVHRTVAGEDRGIIGNTMNMDNRQCDMLSVLRRGQAAVFVEGDDKPIMVDVPYAKIKVPPEMMNKAGSDLWVASHMEPFRSQPHIASLYTPFEACSLVCQDSMFYCDDTKAVLAAREFQEQFAAFVLSIVIQGVLVRDNYVNLLRMIRSRLPQSSLNTSAFKCVVLNALRWYFDYFGRRHHWSYSIVKQLKEILSGVLLEVLPEVETGSTKIIGVPDKINRFQELYRLACGSQELPFPTCSRLCPSGECLFRYHNEMLLKDRRLTQLFEEGMVAAVNSDGWPDMRAIMQAVTRMNGQDMPESVQRSIGLCYGVLHLTYKPGMMEVARDLAIRRLIEVVM